MNTTGRCLCATLALALALMSTGADAQDAGHLDRATVRDPLKWIEGEKPKYPDFVPEPSPPDDPSLPAINPDPVAVRAFILDTYKLLATTIDVKRAVFDFDKTFEYLVHVEIPQGDKTLRWLLLLDTRGEQTRLVRAWAGLDVERAEGTLRAHGFGRRACLVVTLDKVDERGVEVLRFEAGALTTMLAAGARPPDRLEVVTAGRAWSATLEHGAGRVGWRLVEDNDGFHVEVAP